MVAPPERVAKPIELPVRRFRGWAELRPPEALHGAVRGLLGEVRLLMGPDSLWFVGASTLPAGVSLFSRPDVGVEEWSWKVSYTVRLARDQALARRLVAVAASLSQVLNGASGAERRWLDVVGAVLGIRDVVVPETEPIGSLNFVRRLQGFAPASAEIVLRVPDADTPFPEIAAHAQAAFGSVVELLAWHAQRSAAVSGGEPCPSDVLALGLLGDREGVIDRVAGLPRPSTPSEAHHRFSYLALAAAGDGEGAHAHALALAERLPRRQAADVFLLLAHQKIVEGARAAGWEMAVRALKAAPRSAGICERAAMVFESMGEFGEAETLYARALELDSRKGPSMAALTRLQSWRGDDEAAAHGAERLMREHPEDPRGPLLLGLSRIRQGRLQEGIPAIEASLALDPGSSEALLWRAEAHLGRGDFDAAAADLEAARPQTTSPVEALLGILLNLRRGTLDVGGLPRRQQSAVFWNGFFSIQLPLLCTQEEISVAYGSNESMTRLLEGVLESFKGNHSGHVTRVRSGFDGAGLEPVAAMETSRAASANTLKRLRFESPEVVHAGFDDLLGQFPHSPHPFCYRGELALWLGDLAAADDDFDAAMAIEPARWAFVGKAAVAMLLGDRATAMELIEQCDTLFGVLPGATTHVYQGELLRRLEDWQGAERHLEEAIAVKPTRFAASMNLALVRQALGRAEAAASIYGRLWTQVPGIFWTACAQLGIPLETCRQPRHMESVIEESLSMMRGNRSSHLVTYFPEDGRLRVVPRARVWEDVARETLTLAEEWLYATLLD